jgi:hypothetical protein
MSWGETLAHLQPFGREIVQATYADIVTECRRRNIQPVWIYLPMPGVAEAPMRSTELVDLATQAGFVVIDLMKWSDGYAPEEVKLSAADHHASARGHQVIAERLEAALRERPDVLPCGRGKP